MTTDALHHQTEERLKFDAASYCLTSAMTNGCDLSACVGSQQHALRTRRQTQ